MSDLRRMRKFENVGIFIVLRRKTGTIYNDQYFIPGFGSVELADLLEKELASEIKTKALGLEKASGESKLRYATVPAAEVRVGCLSNKQEAILLKREDYIEKIANGIYNAIVSSYETYFLTSVVSLKT